MLAFPVIAIALALIAIGREQLAVNFVKSNANATASPATSVSHWV